MKLALQELCRSDKYSEYEFENDVYAPRILGNADAAAVADASAANQASAVVTANPTGDVWELMERITELAGPVLLLIRLGDMGQATLSKLRATTDYIKTLMVVTGDGSLADEIAKVYHRWVGDLESPVADCVYMVDPQFVAKSINAPATLMANFWTVSRKVIGHAMSDDEWLPVRQQLANELQAFRMKAGGFAFEDYTMTDCVTFWGIAGCHAPLLKRIAFALAPHPCSSSEAERNWFELKQNKTKKRNRLGKDTIQKLIFVRRFLRLERKLMITDISDDGYSKWVTKLLRDATAAMTTSDDAAPEGDNDDEDMEALAVFNDCIEPGEQGKINGKEPGQPRVSLTQLRADKSAVSWLFEKYYNMVFVDKNPEADEADAEILEDASLWEHRRVINIVWSRRLGYVADTMLIGDTSDDNCERYIIDTTLIEMIRASPHNTRRMKSMLHVTLTQPDPNPDVNQTQPDPDSDTPSGEVEDV